MKEIKFVHCSDVHLDMPFTSMGTASQKAAARRQDVRDTFAKIINITQEENADLLLISGDLFEHSYSSRSTVNFLNDMFARISKTKVFILPGNHDPYAPNSFYRSCTWADNVFILTREVPCIKMDDPGICVYGAGFSEAGGALLLPDPLKVDPAYVNIMLFHGTIDLNIGNGAYNPVSASELHSCGMDYIAAGHFHNRLESLEAAGIYNPGSPEPLGFDEPGEHGIFAGCITKDGAAAVKRSTAFVQTCKRHYRTMEVVIDSCCSDHQVYDKIMASAAGDEDMRNDSVSIELRGYIDRDYKVNTVQVEAMLAPVFFHARVKDYSSQEYDLDAIIKEPGLKGLFARKALEAIRAAADERERRVLRKALYYGLEALERNRLEPDAS